MPDPRVVSLNHRLRNLAEQRGITPTRIRNQYVFTQILNRLSRDPRWVLKGGFALELRLGLSARATKDLDLLLWGWRTLSASQLQELLEEGLEAEGPQDLAFHVRLPKQVRIEEESPGTWRVRIDVMYHSSLFGSATLDVVTTEQEPSQGVTLLPIPSFTDRPSFLVRSVDIHRHAAEKFHAYHRIYAHDRPSSRVKDLVDLVLLIEHGLLTPEALARALRQVFQERDRAEPPAAMPRPPANWHNDFAQISASLPMVTTSLDEAFSLVQQAYQEALFQRQ